MIGLGGGQIPESSGHGDIRGGRDPAGLRTHLRVSLSPDGRDRHPLRAIVGQTPVRREEIGVEYTGEGGSQPLDRVGCQQ